jgi:tetrahydromethanopterin S-methyltransferase subunit E
MKVSTTGKDILKWIIIAIVVIAAGLIIIRLVKMKNQRAKEKAEEDQKILNTPIHDMAKSDLEEKYLNK